MDVVLRSVVISGAVLHVPSRAHSVPRALARTV